MTEERAHASPTGTIRTPAGSASGYAQATVAVHNASSRPYLSTISK